MGENHRCLWLRTWLGKYYYMWCSSCNLISSGKTVEHICLHPWPLLFLRTDLYIDRSDLLGCSLTCTWPFVVVFWSHMWGG
jgi:hypothetical protein